MRAIPQELLTWFRAQTTPTLLTALAPIALGLISLAFTSQQDQVVFGVSAQKVATATPASPQQLATVMPTISSPPPGSGAPIPLDRGLNVEICPGRAPSTLESRVKGADAVVEATVIQRGLPKWNTPTGQQPSPLYLDFVSDPAQRIYTPVTLDVKQFLKGQLPTQILLGSQFTYNQFGGSIDKVSMRICGEHQYMPSETVIMFLRMTQLALGAFNGLVDTDAYLLKDSQATGLTYPDVGTTTRDALIARIRLAAAIP